MAYAAKEDVERAAGGSRVLLQIADPENTGMVDSALVERAISRAQTWADSYLSKRESVPLDNPPDFIIDLVADEAVYRLKKPHVTELDVSEHEERRMWLRDFARGENRLGTDPDPKHVSDSEFALRSPDEDNNVITQESGRGFV